MSMMGSDERGVTDEVERLLKAEQDARDGLFHAISVEASDIRAVLARLEEAEKPMVCFHCSEPMERDALKVRLEAAERERDEARQSHANAEMSWSSHISAEKARAEAAEAQVARLTEELKEARCAYPGSGTCCHSTWITDTAGSRCALCGMPMCLPIPPATCEPKP